MGKTITPQLQEQMIKLRKAGSTLAEISKKVGKCPAAVSRILKAHGIRRGALSGDKRRIVLDQVGKGKHS